MSTSMSVRFLIRKERGNDQSEAPIYLRMTIAGERFELSTRRTVLPENWSAELGRVSGTNSKAKSVNTFLDSLPSRAYSYQKQILNEGKELTLTEFKSRWTGVPTERPKIIMEVMNFLH